MTCGADAVVKRADRPYCGRCAIEADWRSIIAAVQSADDAPAGHEREVAESA
jgi:hypothetical protein